MLKGLQTFILKRSLVAELVTSIHWKKLFLPLRLLWTSVQWCFDVRKHLKTLFNPRGLLYVLSKRSDYFG
jgi:hypothetical protein